MFRKKHRKINFAVPKKEVTRIDKNGGEITKNISYILQSIDSARLIARSLNTETITKNAKFAELNISIATVFMNTQTLK